MTLVLPTKQRDYIQLHEGLFLTIATVAHNHTYQEQNDLLHENGALVIGPNDSLALDRLCLTGKAFNGLGERIYSPSLIYDKRHKVESPWRGENLDAYFRHIQNGLFGEGLYVGQYRLDSKGKIIVAYSPLDLDTLMADREISLKDYIKRAHTSQGLPREDVKKGDFYYWHPVNDRIARLYAGCGWANLGCDRGPSDLDDRLGVRAKISTGNLKHFLEELRDRYKK